MGAEARQRRKILPGAQGGPAHRGPSNFMTTYDDKTVLEVIQSAPRDTMTGIRDAAMLAVLWRVGLRPSELGLLHPADARLREVPRSVYVPGTRAYLSSVPERPSRRVPLEPDDVDLLAPWLDAWLQRRPRIPHGRLFCSLRGRPIESSYVRRMLGELSENKLPRGTSLHGTGLRNTYALRLLRRGVPADEVTARMGGVRSSMLLHLQRKVQAQ